MSAERTEGREHTAYTAGAPPGAPPDRELIQRLQETLGYSFDVLDLVGEGPVGLVFRARERTSGQELALKLLAVDPESAMIAYERAQRVARAAAAVGHPGIVVPAVSAPSGEAMFCTTPFFRGGSLENLLASRRPLPLERVVAVLDDVAPALDAAHERRIVHGGVKPTNVVLDVDGHAFLTDAAVAPIFGTAGGAYAAPEQWRGQGVDGRADQYALGVIAYELLTGERRADARNVEGIAVLEPLEISESTPLRPDLGLHVNAALATAMSPSPANRHRSVRAFVDALAGRSGAHVPVAAPSRGFGFGVQSPLLVVVVLGLVAAGVLGATDPDVQRVAGDGMRSLRDGFGSARSGNAFTLRSAAAPRVRIPDVGTSPKVPGAGSRAASRGAAGATPAPSAGGIGGGTTGGGSRRPYYTGPGTRSTVARGAPPGTAVGGSVSGSTSGSTVTGTSSTDATRSAAVSATATASTGRIGSPDRVGGVRAALARFFARFSTAEEAEAAPQLPELAPPTEGDRSGGAGKSLSSRESSPGREQEPQALRRAAGFINVSTVGGSAVVLVDGAARGTTPVLLQVTPGVHRIEVRSPGAAYNPRRRDIPIGDRDTVTLQFMRVPVPR